MTMAVEEVALPATRKKQSLKDLVQREQRRKNRRRLFVGLLLATVPLAVTASWLLLRPEPVPTAARFRTQPASVGDVVREVRATGRLEALTTVQVGAQISGRIANVEVDFNDRVTAGQVLARFDRAALVAQQAEIRATLASARAGVEQAKSDRTYTARQEERTERLFASSLVSESERDSAAAAARVAAQRVVAAEAQLSAQQAAYSHANTNLDYTVIRAPIDGIVVTRNVDPGQTVASALQTPVLFTVAADLAKMRVVVAVDEADIGEVALGQSVTFTVTAYPNRVFRGLVTEVRNSPEVVQDVVTYGTEVEVDNADLALKPGMTATARIRTAFANDVLRVPSPAFEFTPPGQAPSLAQGVWTLNGDALQFTAVAAGVSDGEFTSVSGSLEEGAVVVYELTAEGRHAYGIAH